MGILRMLIQTNVTLSRRVDALLWPSMSEDGNRNFVILMKDLVGTGLTVADVGGGKSPLFRPDEVARRRLTVIGIDIDQAELEAAPHEAYNRTVHADITVHRGREEADVVIVQSALEHIRDNAAGMQGIASFCKPGGLVYTFCPNRRAWFAVINRVLPERLKRKILYAIYPQTEDKQGFRAFYDRCTPRQLSLEMEAAGLRVERIDPYFVSSYFMFFFPLHLFWRIVTLPLMKLWPMTFCETFVIHASKPKT